MPQNLRLATGIVAGSGDTSRMIGLSHEGFRACVFTLSGQSFGIRLDDVREIVPMAALSHPPSMPSVLEGFLNLGGTAIPVLRVASVLGLPPQRLELYTPLVIIHAGSLPLALLVHSVTHIMSVAASAVVPMAATDSFNGCVEGSWTEAETVVHLLSANRLLLAKEQQALAQFQAAETDRLRQIDSAPS